tara:strand:+ start:106 stop:429 length:324 start_codon:yes stop_codon:yes gene_type:complete
MKVNIKPLSVNECFKGRRFRTEKYNTYERNLKLLLPKFKVPDGKLFVTLGFGFSSKLADIDNPVKAFIDVLQKKYNFNDRDIFKLHIDKEIVKKGKEYIKFEIKSIK